MAGGFGYTNYSSARPTPSSEAVGAALMQRNQGQGGQMQQPPDYPEPGDTPDVSPEQTMRMEGATKMGGPGQIDEAQADDGAHSVNAVNVAVGEALTRMSGGFQASKNPYRDQANHMRQLQQLGLSEVEAQLLVRTGGV